MFKNYLKIAIRHLTSHKLFSVINILCLSIGITFSLIIGIYILNEESVNTNLKNVDNQYIIKSNWKLKDMGLDVTTLGPLAKTLKTEYPNLVANYYRYNPVTNVVSAGYQHFKEDIAIGDTTFVNMYGLKLLFGNPTKAFENNNSAVITETMAQKLFGRTEVIGKRISMQTTVNGESQDYTISAVLKDMSYNSVFNLVGDTYNVLVPSTGNRYFQNGDGAENWNQLFEVGMVELKKGITPKDLENPIKQILAKYTPETIQENLQVNLAPVKTYYSESSSVHQMIITLSLVATFILFMAIINFVNINIGISSYRLKEIGLRKVFGSARRQLIIQFITEALMLTFIAAIISFVLYELLRSAFGNILNTSFPPFWKFSFDKFLLIGLLVFVVGFVAGIYPAFILSASNVLLAVKGKIGSAKGGLMLRKVLLVVQFTLAIIVFISALNVSKQISYVFHKDLGYNKEQLMIVNALPKQWDSAGVKRLETIKAGLQQLSFVKDASISFEVPDRKPPNAIDLLPSGTNINHPIFIPIIVADKDYAGTFGLHVESGTFFNQDGANIPGQVVLNESAAKVLGYTVESAVGKQIKWASAKTMLTVSGVIKDYNYSSLQEKIEPVAFVNTKDILSYRYLTLKLNTPNMANAINQVKEKWKSLSPNSPFEYTFMDNKFQSLYKSELQLKSATNIASILNLVIVFMGIFGVVAFTLAKRSKEIAVRKVLGAEVKNIILLFIKDYAWLILVANIIAWPIAYLVINHWLEGYAYRIDQHIVSYLFAGIIVFATAFIFITLQCYKTAVSNPVKNLRTE
jgi:ABC-type antimicrobial peptide transport system permease subunit